MVSFGRKTSSVDGQEKDDPMDRLLVHVEGQTEETFVNQILAPHLCNFGYSTISARLIGNARQRVRRGGIRSWSSVRSDILAHIKQDASCLATTMVDYYGLPKTGPEAWPGRNEAGMLAFHHKAASVEAALSADICKEMGSGFNPNRFIPFVIMHEFEGLLFSDCEKFSRGIGQPELAPNFQAIRKQFPTPEEINDSPITAPSKRIEKLVPGYEKPLLGTLAVLEIGLDRIRDECPHFRNWLEKLETRRPT